MFSALRACLSCIGHQQRKLHYWPPASLVWHDGRMSIAVTIWDNLSNLKSSSKYLSLSSAFLWTHFKTVSNSEPLEESTVISVDKPVSDQVKVSIIPHPELLCGKFLVSYPPAFEQAGLGYTCELSYEWPHSRDEAFSWEILHKTLELIGT